jgi:hypothetical protein
MYSTLVANQAQATSFCISDSPCCPAFEPQIVGIKDEGVVVVCRKKLLINEK